MTQLNNKFPRRRKAIRDKSSYAQKGLGSTTCEKHMVPERVKEEDLEVFVDVWTLAFKPRRDFLVYSTMCFFAGKFVS